MHLNARERQAKTPKDEAKALLSDLQEMYSDIPHSALTYASLPVCLQRD